jgi:preprotein translocase subunit SecA
VADFLVEQGYTLLDVSQPDALQKLYKAARDGVPSKLFTVLNARFHEQEAIIVAEAGVPGAITVATNMAGRGTDIQLGGNVEMRVEHELKEVEPGPERDAREAAIRAEVASFREKTKAAGGLYIVGTERHESRRIDNQLRGRAGRQGDEGRSKFYLSLKDDLMRIFGSDRMENMLVKLGLREDEAIVHPWINKALEKAQQKVEARNFDMRKNILKYDDVMNDQRKVVFEQRREMMASASLEEMVADMRNGVVDDIVARHIPHDAYPEAWDINALTEEVERAFNVSLPLHDWQKEEGISDETMRERLHAAAEEVYAKRIEKNGPDVMRYVEKQIVLQVLDTRWRGLAQQDPLNEYKREAFQLFDELITQLRETTVSQLNRVEIAFEQPAEAQMIPPLQASQFEPMNGHHEDLRQLMERLGTSDDAVPHNGATIMDALGGDTDTLSRRSDDPSTWGRVGRNESCPCGSGKKYKHCHGALNA